MAVQLLLYFIKAEVEGKAEMVSNFPFSASGKKFVSRLESLKFRLLVSANDSIHNTMRYHC